MGQHGDRVTPPINTNHVVAVLLADGWHQVEQKGARSTFDILPFAFVEGRGQRELATAGAGAVWTEAGGIPPAIERVSCPLSSILAVRTRPAPETRA